MRRFLCVIILILLFAAGYWCGALGKTVVHFTRIFHEVFASPQNKLYLHVCNNANCMYMQNALHLHYIGVVKYEFRQERARVKVCHPKFFNECIVFTGRKSRNDPYLTNMTGTTLVPFANNISFALTLSMKAGGDFRIVIKVCELAKNKWTYEFMSKYTNVLTYSCPYPPATYKYWNMELPPKNLPIPIADGDYLIRMEMFVTATKETILDLSTLLHFEPSKKSKKG